MRKDKDKETKIQINAAIPICILLITASALSVSACSSKGCEDYSVQMQQHYVEYSDEYDYWDVLTVEYPQLENTNLEFEEALNEKLYDVAMDRVNYWHLSPDEDVQAFQEEHFSIFCSDVCSNVTFHSQYLLSVDYLELYSTGNPVWYTVLTERALNLDLVTGESYELSDIFNIDRDFIKLWCNAAQKRYSDIFEGDAEEIELFLSWFLSEDEETKERYELHTFFYPTEEDSFIIGIAYDPKPSSVSVSQTEARDVTYSVELTSSELEPFRTESEFWKEYDSSESTGQILECEDKKSNLWLGEGASVWSYWGKER